MDNSKKINLVIPIIFAILLSIPLFTMIKNKVNESITPTNHIIELSVTGSAYSAFVTYSNSSGGTEQISGVKLPWSKSFVCKGKNIISLIAQNRSIEGDIVVTIYVDNVPVNSSRSEGSYVVATTSTMVDDD